MLPNSFGQIDMPLLLFRTPTRSVARPAGRAGKPHGASTGPAGNACCCGIGESRSLATMAEIEAFAAQMQDISSGPRFASVKIDPANLERVLSNRDGAFIVNRGALGYRPI
jgi:hypothetical protein